MKTLYQYIRNLVADKINRQAGVGRQPAVVECFEY